ncbi:Predicted amidohydrolase YtcJ [Pseudomonas syringae pv. actinidiae]|uniref:Predicted amidohydrolase YtcJ n=1 Tax=Pseudomonas syringae pv. actinidiae TaxID=103796 RepID=A0A2V0QRF8_PSESF|nr:Predicted amidohydrolase YtcJ [Pseudomonas syringae pv. actinidiae]
MLTHSSTGGVLALRLPFRTDVAITLAGETGGFFGWDTGITQHSGGAGFSSLGHTNVVGSLHNVADLWGGGVTGFESSGLQGCSALCAGFTVDPGELGANGVPFRTPAV